MNCRYCQGNLQQSSVFDEWMCNKCDVAFMSSMTESDHIRFHRVINGENFHFNLFRDNKQTIIIIDDDSTEYSYAELGFPFYTDGVTPDNVVNKIKLLLVFS